ncbi:DNA polymerase III delta prime subunit [Rhodoglobus vestalii]|uniref:DNA polymerase III delta prime subunit n=1 Tax=Rhodoglobus vestalii TaxID=193384 RepID=A0A8H2K5Q1_9MICO|nr:DNA polymerase III subunit delta' [Rhodoglobus vestalii]TQO19394.1 DNA polymerase III delta prime subunit [Rhodoglobus vestalii]
MSLWEGLTGQADAIAVLESAASSSALGSTDESSMTHSWLITGPPGSGRSNIAYAFAAALLGTRGDETEESVYKQVIARTHPDLGVLSTERVIISIDEVRKLVSASQFSPSVGHYRVMIIEDADRMAERTSNVLLKALEEPPPRTVWILCAPSEADLIPTIRSRVRSVRLRTPAIADVAQLLHERDGVAPDIAARAAREAQSHIGMAHRLATNAEARERRETTLTTALGIRTVSEAVIAAATLLELSKADATALTEERDAQERESALRSLGVAPGGTIPPALRAQLKAMEEDQKRRATRGLRDGLDRVMVDLLSLYRDILLTQIGAPGELINLSILNNINSVAERTTAVSTLAIMDGIAEARHRIDSNVSPALALEAMLVKIAVSGRGA